MADNCVFGTAVNVLLAPLVITTMFQLGGPGGDFGAPPSAEKLKKAKEQELIELKFNLKLFFISCVTLKLISIGYDNFIA